MCTMHYPFISSRAEAKDEQHSKECMLLCDTIQMSKIVMVTFKLYETGYHDRLFLPIVPDDPIFWYMYLRRFQMLARPKQMIWYWLVSAFWHRSMINRLW